MHLVSCAAPKYIRAEIATHKTPSGRRAQVLPHVRGCRDLGDASNSSVTLSLMSSDE